MLNALEKCNVSEKVVHLFVHDQHFAVVKIKCFYREEFVSRHVMFVYYTTWYVNQ